MQKPWVGGMNAPQWSSFDINQDGKKDLYAFDRMGNVHLLFINKSENNGEINYEYNRHLLKYFPHVQDFVLMRDFNQDGVIDLFASAKDENLQGIKVFKGYLENGFIKFNRINFPDFTDDIIPYYASDTIVDQVRIWIQVHYPAVEDIDGDGDLDILAMDIDGSKVHLYKNISLEKGWDTDTLIYELADDCWGRFGLTADTAALITSSDMNMCAFFNDPDLSSEKNNVHGGTTLCLFDNDNDGDKELLMGDLINNKIVFGKNNGNSETAWMTEQDIIFPSYNTPIEISDFPATYFLDINNDGARDLIASPNQTWKSPDIETAWFYENTGSDQFPEFDLVQKDFFGEQILDFGTGANPVFIDVNGDGLKDIVCGNREFWAPDKFVAPLNLLLNTGTAAAPEFESTEEDWLGLSQYSPELNSLSPAFGDLDNDGDLDLLIGDFDGRLHFAENIAGPNTAMQFDDFIFNWKNIDVGQIATPFIFDVNKDGLPDLIIGELRGTINYLPNIGTPENPEFHPNPDEAPNNFFFGAINTQPLNSSVGYAQPQVFEISDSMYLTSGSLRGWIKRYLINPDSLDGGTFVKLNDRLGNLREGATTRIYFENIDDDHYLEAIIGNDRGGLSLFKSSIQMDSLVNSREISFTENKPYKLFPNPSNGIIYLNVFDKIDIAVYDVLGREIYFEKNVYLHKKIDLINFDSGIYFIKINKANKFYTEKIILKPQ
ncbi:MAG: T9SS type A sorting domain-containing protein [Bacteroidota bacterium]